MRPHYSSNNSDSDGFSTIFGDLVFGLLFVFFLLAIALVFNRPDVDAFQDKIDDMQGKMRQALKEMGELTEKIAELEKRIAALQEKKKEKEIRLSSLASEMKRLEEDGKEKIRTLAERNTALAETFKKFREAAPSFKTV